MPKACPSRLEMVVPFWFIAYTARNSAGFAFYGATVSVFSSSELEICAIYIAQH